MKPENPYRKSTLIWSVMEGDWEDLTIKQIAEVLDTSPTTVYDCITRIRRKTGYAVPYIRVYRTEKAKKEALKNGFQKH